MQVISNGELKASEHRVVTNASSDRTTASVFIFPSNDAFIKPETTLLDASHNPPLYKAIQYKDYRSYFSLNSQDAKKMNDLMDKSNN